MSPDPLFYARCAAGSLGLSLGSRDWKCACEQLPHLAAFLGVKAEGTPNARRRPDLLRDLFKELAAALDASDRSLARSVVRHMLLAAGFTN